MGWLFKLKFNRALRKYCDPDNHFYTLSRMADDLGTAPWILADAVWQDDPLSAFQERIKEED